MRRSQYSMKSLMVTSAVSSKCHGYGDSTYVDSKKKKKCGCCCVCALSKALILHHTSLTRVIGVSRSVIPTKPRSQKRNCFMPWISGVTLTKTQKRQLDFWKEFGRGFLLYWDEWKRVWESHQHVLGVPFQNILKDYTLGI